MTLRFYATGSMLIVMGDFGGIDPGTASRVIAAVSIELAGLLLTYIRMPLTDQDLEETKNEFKEIANFPNVIGAIDCTHVRIQSPGKIYHMSQPIHIWLRVTYCSVNRNILQYFDIFLVC